LLSSTVWRQDHNGFSHQDPGFIDLVTNKSASVTRIYLPPDANCLLSVADHCLRSTDYVNVIVADKQNHMQFLTIDQAVVHCTKGISIWARASNDEDAEPDVVMASCGDVPTLEALAAVAILRERLPDLKVRFVNVVDLYKMQSAAKHPHGLKRSGLRQLVHHQQTGDFQLPRLSLADPQAGVPVQESCEPACSRLQGEGQHQHASGACHSQPDRSFDFVIDVIDRYHPVVAGQHPDIRSS
jgi:hypothetical protein